MESSRPSSHLVSQPNVFTWATDKYHTPRGELPQPLPFQPPVPTWATDTSRRAPSTPIPSHPNLVYSFEPQVKSNTSLRATPTHTSHPNHCTHLSHRQISITSWRVPPTPTPSHPNPLHPPEPQANIKHLVKSSPHLPLISQPQHPPEPKVNIKHLVKSSQFLQVRQRLWSKWRPVNEAFKSVACQFFFTTNKPGKLENAK